MGHEIMLVLRATLATFVESLARFLPRALSALVVLVVGWLLATILRAVTRKVLTWIRLDSLIERVGAGEMLKRSGLPPPHRLVAGAVYWLTWAAVGSAMLEILGVAGGELLVADFVRFLPRVVAAAAILLAGFVVSSLAWRAALLGAVSAHMHAAKIIGAVVRALVMAATIAMALEQLGLGSGIMHTAFAITFGAVMLALAIAFGLGGRHAARRFLEQRLLSRGKVDEDGRSHL